MTTYVQARDTLVTKIDDALTSSYPTLKVFWENTTEVDTNTVGNNFVQVEVTSRTRSTPRLRLTSW